MDSTSFHRVTSKLTERFGQLAWWLFPETCPGCGARLEDPTAAFCPDCLVSVHPITEPMCPICFLPYPSGTVHPCRDCTVRPPPYERAVAVFEYGGAVAQAIRRFKYGPALHLARPLGRLLAGHLEALEPDLVVPVPARPSAVRRRGFNHAAELAKWACRFAHIPSPKALLRRLDGGPQAGKSLAERSRLPAHTFWTRADLSGIHVVLTDDVITTTATARAASRILVEAGARVSVVALARTPK